MRLLTLIHLASAATAASLPKPNILARTDIPQPLDCVPLSCGEGSRVVCRDNEQQCQIPAPTYDETGYRYTGMARHCSNETYSPTYPLETFCIDNLQPFDATKIPTECSGTMCTNMDGNPYALWCLYFYINGMSWKRLPMQCAPGSVHVRSL